LGWMPYVYHDIGDQRFWHDSSGPCLCRLHSSSYIYTIKAKTGVRCHTFSSDFTLRQNTKLPTNAIINKNDCHPSYPVSPDGLLALISISSQKLVRLTNQTNHASYP
jgi:hypothetical protein